MSDTVAEVRRPLRTAFRDFARLRIARRPSPALVGWLSTAIILAISLIRNRYLFTDNIHEDGDFALNSILVDHTHHGVQLVGNYSRVGFDHPGPAYIYVISAGQTIFHDLFHIVPSQYDGQVVGDIVLQSALIGLIIMSIYRATRSLVALTVAGSTAFCYAATHELLGTPWMPYMYMTAFALLIAAGTAFAAGHTGDLPLVVLAGSFLVHGHVAFLAFVGASVVLVVAGWLINHRRRWRAELGSSRRALWWSLAILVVFLTPMVAEIVLHYPGPWRDYYRYSRAHASAPHSVADSVDFLGHFWSVSLYLAVAIGAAAIGLLALVLDRNPQRRNYFLWGYLILALETVVFLYYISRGIDILNSTNYYAGFFYETVPMFLVVFAATHAAMLLHERLLESGLAWGPVAVPIVAAAVGLALIINGSSSTKMTYPYFGNNMYPQIVAALAADPDRHGQPVRLDITGDTWPAAAGMVVQGYRKDLSICISDPAWKLLFTSEYICYQSAGHWQASIVTRAAFTNQGPIIWSDANFVVFAGSTHTSSP